MDFIKNDCKDIEINIEKENDICDENKDQIDINNFEKTLFCYLNGNF